MKFTHCLALGVLAALPFAAGAQQVANGSVRQAGPLDAGASVPALIYVSAFKDYQGTADEAASPEQAWRAANETVGKLGGHAGHIKGNADAAQAVRPATAAEVSHTSSRSTAMPMKHGHHHH